MLVFRLRCRSLSFQVIVLSSRLGLVSDWGQLGEVIEIGEEKEKIRSWLVIEILLLIRLGCVVFGAAYVPPPLSSCHKKNRGFWRENWALLILSEAGGTLGIGPDGPLGPSYVWIIRTANDTVKNPS